ncbi:hypothetical protein PILCRDRAFT_59170 [Piloderma croceum F 1598]|uniref:Peptidase S28 n=1 Tax=Piloderma croceum (strain F 1598) TaxID=765440 RepID=A0A0C3GKV0_PILCF|nr:hypothetical protein PILCRDRAFT_59170 [Piloderma croceum F 1598]
MASIRLLTSLLVFLSLRSVVNGLVHGRPHGNMMPTIPMVKISDGRVMSRNGTKIPSLNSTYYFDQLIDHTNPGLGIFKQRYWHTWEWYEPGGPIILSTPGEINADGFEGYLTNKTINGQIAQQQKGATIVLEHRFYGQSNPYNNLSVQSLQVHTIQQAIEDLVYFAENVKLAMPGGDNVTPDVAPWILIGGSYAGALTAWTMTNKPGVFWAGYSSSGVVEALVDFWAYYEPIRQYMPKNCSADVEAVTAYVDEVFTNGTDDAVAALKSNWGMGNVSHLDDIVSALRNQIADWQELQPTSGPGAAFFNFCDALEVKNGQKAPPTGWGLDYALAAWGRYWNHTYFAISKSCGHQDAETCLGTYDTSQSYWTNTTVDNSARSWQWIVCNEVGYFQESPPQGQPAIVSRLVQPIYDERQCAQLFPEQFSEPSAPNVDATNSAYGGWTVNVTRLFFANGQRDPWRDVTVSADGQNIQSSPTQPIFVSDGFHCSDLSTAAGLVDPTIAHVQSEALSYMKTWLADWKPSSNGPVVQRSTEIAYDVVKGSGKRGPLAGRGMLPTIRPQSGGVGSF